MNEKIEQMIAKKADMFKANTTKVKEQIKELTEIIALDPLLHLADRTEELLSLCAQLEWTQARAKFFSILENNLEVDPSGAKMLRALRHEISIQISNLADLNLTSFQSLSQQSLSTKGAKERMKYLSHLVDLEKEVEG